MEMYSLVLVHWSSLITLSESFRRIIPISWSCVRFLEITLSITDIYKIAYVYLLSIPHVVFYYFITVGRIWFWWIREDAAVPPLFWCAIIILVNLTWPRRLKNSFIVSIENLIGVDVHVVLKWNWCLPFHDNNAPVFPMMMWNSCTISYFSAFRARLGSICYNAYFPFFCPCEIF